MGSDVHEVHARSDQVSHIAILAYNSNCVVVPRRWFLRICLFRVFSSMSDDPCRLMTNLARSTRSTNRRQRRSARPFARHNGAALVRRSPSRVRVMEHGALTAPRPRVGAERGVVRSRVLTGARARRPVASGPPTMLTVASTHRASACVPQQPSRLRLGARRSSAMEGLRLAPCGAYGCGGRRLRGLTVRSHSGPHGATPATAPSPSPIAPNPIRLIP